jgi:DegV family protein with EDD domain
MNQIAVVTDSTCCIPDELVQKYGIHIVPLIIIWDKIQYRDGVDIKALDFFKKLRTVTTNFPSTTSAVQGPFLELFQKLRGQVNGVVVIVLGKRIPTAAFDSALNAARMVPELKIEIVDTDITGIGMGFAVLAAAKLAASGGNLEEVAEIARSTAGKTHTFWMQESLDYIRRGGRVQLPQLNEAEWQNVKPLMTFRDGKIVPIEKQPTKENAMDRILQLMSENTKINSPLHVAVMHADDAQGAEELRTLISRRFKCSELLMTEFTPIMGAHFGPGSLGISFYNE